MAEQQLEVLEGRLAAAATPQEKAAALNALSSYWEDKELQQAYELAQAAFALSQANPESDNHFDSLFNLSRTCQRLGELSLALQWALEAKRVAEILASAQKQALSLGRLGSIYEQLGNYTDSLACNLEALNLAQQAGDHAIQANALNTIGILYNRTGNYRQELATYQRALLVAQAIEDVRSECILYNNIAMAYYSLQEYKLALENAHRGRILAQNQVSGFFETNAICTIADIYEAMGDDTQAREYLQLGLAAAISQSYHYLAIYAHLSLGRILSRSGELDTALIHLQTALQMAEQQQSPHEMFQCHEVLASLYKQKGDLAQALYHYEQFHILKETLFNEQSRQTIRNLQVLHQTETARRDAEIYRLKSEELEAEINRRQTAEEALRQRTLELETQNAELDAFAHTVAHDLKSPLSVLLGLTGDADELLPLLSPNEIQQSWQMIGNSTQKLINIVDELLLLASVRGQDIQPEPLEMGGLVSQALARVNHHVKEYGGEIVLPDFWLIPLGYAPWVEEVWVNYLSNAFKYGGRPPLIQLGNEHLPDRQIRFWVRDNGAGLSPEQIERLFIPFERLHQVHTKGHGLGLSIVRRIVEKLGGRVGAISNQNTGQGSTFYFTLPGM